ncbi:MAG: hypothetical protein IJP10_01520, partial [Clostridia bacterium]|nr:hypothetical protein [Clostridia bacterium]
MKKTFTMKAAISLVLILCVIFCGMPVYAQTTEGESVSATDSAPASEPTVTTPSDTAGAPSSEPTVETVSDVEAIDLAIPVFGANPDFDVTVPANGKFAVSSVKWEKLESTTTEFITTVLSANDKFEEGEYQVTITFRATGGAKFKVNANGVITGRINGDVAMPASSVTNDGLYDTYAICTVFSVEASSQPAVETVSDVEANDLTVPAYGANPDFDL